MNSLISLFVVIIAILLFYYFPSNLNFEPKVHDIPFPSIEDIQAPSTVMDMAWRVHEGVLLGPECLEVGPDGHIYTGLKNGVIVRLAGDKIEKVAMTGSKDCQNHHGNEMHKECGRPLGLRFGKNGLLYVADAYSGLISVDIDTGNVTQLLPLFTTIEGKHLMLPDDLDIDQDENIYFSDGSTKWGIDFLCHLALERQTDGRIIKYSIRNGKAEVAVDGISFPNGVQLSTDGNSLLICEFNLRRIIRYYIKGPKVGKTEIFADKLPGYPDNIRPSRNGGYWVAVIFARNETQKFYFDTILNSPTVLQVIIKAHEVISSILEFIGNKISCTFLKDWGKKVLVRIFWILLDGGNFIALELDSVGQPVRSFIAPISKFGPISHVLDHNNNLYLGSFLNDYLITLKP